MSRYEVTIEGEKDLLMHKFPIETKEELKDRDKPGHLDGVKKTPEEEAENCAYRDEGGNLAIPAEHVYQALVKCASAFRIKGQGKKTYKDNVKGCTIIHPEMIPFKNRSDYEIDSRPVRIQKSRIIRHRPRIKEGWILIFTIEILDDGLVPEKAIKDVMDRVALVNGLGDYRPRFGKFSVTGFKKL
jgi:hypothetical protein